jgi:catalase
MPLTTDEKVLKLSRDALDAFDKENGGVHPGFRAAHAKGVMLTGSFTPTADARSLTRAPHVQRDSTPVTVRFSDFAGVPTIPDNDPQGAGPRGFAVRFHLAEHVHTDIIGHSTDNFPARTVEELIEFLNALSATRPTDPRPNTIERFLATHPPALAFVQTPKPIPTSFARESFFAVSAFKFTNAQGESRFGRYRVVPAAGPEHLDDTAAAAQGSNFLMDEIRQRVARNPIELRIVVQLAEAGDVTDDATVRWPESRRQIEFGRLMIDALVPDDASAQRQIIFDPIPRVDGIDPSADPLFEPRANVYLMSGRRRRGERRSTHVG